MVHQNDVSQRQVKQGEIKGSREHTIHRRMRDEEATHA